MALPVAPPDPVSPPSLRSFFHDTEDTAADHETRIGSGESGLAAHLADTSDAHDASAISFVPTGTVASTEVQAAIAEVASEAVAALALKAPVASPTFTGTPGAPTAVGGTSTTQLATTAFVATAVAALINAAPGTLDTLKELADALGDDPNYAASTATALAGKVASSTLTTDGDLLTRAAGIVARITRASLAGDVAFTALYATLLDPLGLGFPCTADPRSRFNKISVVGSGRIYYSRFIGGMASCSKIGLEIGDQSGNFSVAIYSGTGSGQSAAPGARKATTGLIAVPAAGYQEVALTGSTPIAPGDWVGLGADNTTATFWCSQTGVAGGTPLKGVHGKQDGQSGVCPTTATIANEVGPNFILIGVA